MELLNSCGRIAIHIAYEFAAASGENVGKVVEASLLFLRIADHCLYVHIAVLYGVGYMFWLFDCFLGFGYSFSFIGFSHWVFL